jgi:type IV pilus assembly protein PilO
MNKLKQLPVYWQLIVFVGVAALLYGGFWYMLTSGMRTETQGVEDQVAALRQKNEAARVATQRIDQFRALYQSKTSEYEELKVLLPEQREITNVLQGLQDTAGGSQLSLLRFSPKDDAQQGFITAKAVEVEVSSNFGNLRAFFEKMARLPRIVSITDFKINQRPKQSADKTIDSQFVLTAYYASAENEQAQLAKPGAPGAPAGTAVPNVAPGMTAPPAK